MISILIVFTALIFSGCKSNMSIGFGNFNFTRVHFSVGNIECCEEISSWHENEIGCEVELKNGNHLYLSEGTYILIESECPICK